MTNGFPVDTHVFRVTKRLGWVPHAATYERAHQILGELIPPDRYFPLRINLIRHGREICVAGVPRCEICTLTDVCEYYRAVSSSKRWNSTEGRGAKIRPESRAEAIRF